MVETEETIDIENSGNDVTLDLRGHATVSVHIRGDAPADYDIDVATRRGSWINGGGQSYSSSSDYDDVISTGATRIRVRCTSGTAGSGDSATITLMAGG